MKLQNLHKLMDLEPIILNEAKQPHKKQMYLWVYYKM